MRDTELALATMHRICKKAGAEQVSDSAAKELAKTLDDIEVKIAKEAIDYAMHAEKNRRPFTLKGRTNEMEAR